MTPSQIIALIRDAAIVGALAFLVWRVYTDGANSVKVADMQAVQKQLRENDQHAAQYALQSQQADTQRQKDLAQVNAGIAAQRAPIVVLRGPANPSTVSCNSPSATGGTAGTGGNISGAGADPVDVREPINQFEGRIEKVIADCRAALAKWPK